MRNWRRWGPYLADRQWGTVREDYSPTGECWTYLPHDHARSRAYRWGEDGLLGICDRECRLCFGLALWNGNDPILKERLFGLTGPEGNHGEDVKELYYYLDATPTRSYLQARSTSIRTRRSRTAGSSTRTRRRGKGDREFEIEDTGVFDDRRYWDVFVEYAKAGPDDLLIDITSRTAATRGDAPRVAAAVAPQHLVVGPPRRRLRPRPADRSRERDGVPVSASRRSATFGSMPKAVPTGCSPITRPTPSGCSTRRARARHQRRVSSPRRRRDRRGRESARHPAPSARRGTCSTSRARSERQCGCGYRPTASRRDAVRRFRCVFAKRDARGRRLSRTRRDRADDRRRARDRASSRRRARVVAQVLSLHRRALARRRSGAAAPPASAQARPQSRLGAAVGARRDRDARRLGVSVVRRVGSRVPLRRDGALRSRSSRSTSCCC